MSLSQNMEVLAHMSRIGPITPREALDRYGCFRLAARIYDLRGKGHTIHKDWYYTPSGKRVAKYWMEKQAQ